MLLNRLWTWAAIFSVNSTLQYGVLAVLDFTSYFISHNYVYETNYLASNYSSPLILASTVLAAAGSMGIWRPIGFWKAISALFLYATTTVTFSFAVATFGFLLAKFELIQLTTAAAPDTRRLFCQGLEIGVGTGQATSAILGLFFLSFRSRRNRLQNMLQAVEPSPQIVLLVHHWFWDVFGGSFRVASELANYLANNNHSVAYVCCSTVSQQELWRSETKGNLTIFRYRAPRFPVPFIRWWQHSARCREIIECLRDSGCVQVLYAHSPLQAAGGFAVRFPSQVRKVYTVHSPFDDEFLSQTRSNLLTKFIGAWFAKRIENKNIKQADLIHTLSQYTLKVLQDKFGADQMQSRVEPGWIPGSANTQGSPSRQEARKKLGQAWNFSGPIFFTLRRLENRMGIHLIVDAVEKIRTEFDIRKSPTTKAESTLPEFRVIISGDGSLRKELEEKVTKLGLQQYLFFTGKLTEEERELAYQAADCFVLPTLALECFGLIVLESYVAGIPVIASNVAAIPELVRLLGEEWLFDCGDAESLAVRMKQFIDGALVPSKSPREIAALFSRERILPEWERMLIKSILPVSGND